MATPRKNSKKVNPSQSTQNKMHISVAMPSLSALDPETIAMIESEIKTNIFNSINDSELKNALDKWSKENNTELRVEERDYLLLKSLITEYLDSYVLFGYNTKGQRILIQHAELAKDRDALSEFQKNIFMQQQQSNFMDFEEDDEDEGGQE
jgi:hypothetical protein